MAINTRKILYLIIILNFIIGISAIILQVYAAGIQKTLESNSTDTSDKNTLNIGIATIAAGIAVTGSCIGAGIALRSVASAGFAASVEKPELKSWMFIMGGLAEGIAIYGLLIAILILGKI